MPIPYVVFKEVYKKAKLQEKVRGGHSNQTRCADIIPGKARTDRAAEAVQALKVTQLPVDESLRSAIPHALQSMVQIGKLVP